MTSMRRALALSLIERYLLLALALASNIILARLLTPEQIGIFSVSLAVVGMAQILRDFGIGNFLIQEPTLTDDHVRAAFTLSSLLAVTLLVLLVACAPWIAGFYGEPRMATTLRICALQFAVLPFGSIALALLRREMRFREMLYVNISAAVIAFVVTIALAWRGGGPDALAIGTVVSNVATSMGAWWLRGHARFLSPSLREWSAVAHFGMHTSVANVVVSAAADINDIALGKLLGFGPVAIFSRAQGLVAMVSRELMGAVRNVAYPSFAREHREGKALEASHVAGVTALTALFWPFYGFLALFALEVMRLLFGHQWDAAAPLVPVLAASAAVLTLSSLINTVLLAVGQPAIVARAELVVQPLRVVVVVAAALHYRSLLACAVASLALWILYTPMIYLWKGRCRANDYAALARGLGRSLAVTLITLAVPVGVALWAGLSRIDPVSLPVFLGTAAFAGAAWLLAVQYTGHPLSREAIFRKLGMGEPR